MRYCCPVCYLRLKEDPYISLEICARCGTEFGIDDAGPEIETKFDLSERHQKLRCEWLSKQNICQHCSNISYDDSLCVRCRNRINLKCKFCGSILSNKKCQCLRQIDSILREELDLF